MLEEAKKEGYDSVLAMTPPNIFYFGGFWGEGYLFFNENEAYLIAAKLEYDRAKASALEVEVIKAERGKEMVKEVKKLAKNRKVCIDDPPASKYLNLSKELKDVISCNADLFHGARMVKDEAEIEKLIEGGKIMDRIFEFVGEIIRPGIRERELAAQIVQEMMSMRANPVVYEASFDPIVVASGPNGSLPHATVTDRLLSRGDFVVVDIVLRYHGYIVDATRTYCLGEPDEFKKMIYDAVLKAQERALSLVRPGTKVEDVDAQARNYLKSLKLDEYFIHSTGHGIGLDVHEPPWLRPESQEVLEEGMSITIEPGIYIPGKLGVRIEDSVIVAPNPILLTSYPKELR
jgi:Xaa-Pro aminopeptidase/Xaa-Pro dipeptidase